MFVMDPVCMGQLDNGPSLLRVEMSSYPLKWPEPKECSLNMNMSLYCTYDKSNRLQLTSCSILNFKQEISNSLF